MSAQNSIGTFFTGLTASAWNVLAPSTLYQYTSVPSSSAAVLPSGTGGATGTTQVVVVNADTNALTIYPPLGGTLNGGSVNGTVSVAGGASATFWSAGALTWYSVTSASTGGGSGSPGGSSGQIQYDNGGAFGGFTASGDATINTSTGAVTVTKTNGVAFAPSATTDTTDASNITSGTLPAAPFPALTGAVVNTAGSLATTFGAIAADSIVANTTGGSAAPAGVTLTAALDAIFGSTEGNILQRGSSAWGVLAPPTSASLPFQSGGTSAINSWNSAIVLPTAAPARWTTGPFFKITGAGTAVADTTTPTNIFVGASLGGGTLTIPANALSAGQSLRLHLCGTYGCTSSTPTLQLAIQLQGTNVAIGSAVTLAAAVTNGYWSSLEDPFVIVFPTVGGSGTCFADGQILVYNNSGTAASIRAINGTTAGAPTGTSNAVDTASSMVIGITVTWGTANASNTFQLTGGFGEIAG